MKNESNFRKFWQFFWRSWAIQCSWNYERQMNMGFLYGIVPTLDRIYPDNSAPQQVAYKKEAYKRHMAFYNCTPQTSAFTLGLAASMEEEYAANRDTFNPDSINAVKTSLMGPLSGVGDSFFQGTIKVIAFGLGVSLAQQGSILGPILAMLISFFPSAIITWFAGKLGYTMGSKYLSKLQGGLMDQVMFVCGIVRPCGVHHEQRRQRRGGLLLLHLPDDGDAVDQLRQLPRWRVLPRPLRDRG